MINKINNTLDNYRSLVPGLYNSSCGEDCNCESCNPSEKNKTKTEIFIEKAKKVHGDRYDYSKVNYVNAVTKVTIICKKHNKEFLQIPYIHLSGSGCPRCSNNQKFTSEEFIKKAIEIHGDKYDYSKVNYVNNRTKVTIICKKHNKEFLQTPNSHLNGNGCPKCSNDQKSTTSEEFIKKAIEIHGDKYDYQKVDYVNSYTKITITCPIHGDFEQTPNSHLVGKGCPNCGYDDKKSTLEEFIERAIEIHGDKYDYSKVDYVNAVTKITIICKKHNKEFLQTPCNHLRGEGCPRCKCDNKKSTSKEFIEKAKKIHGDKYDYQKVDYVNAVTKVTIICRKHNKEFLQTPNSHLAGKGCPMCNSSHMEIDIRKLLIENDIDFKEQWNWGWLKYKSLQYVDFYLPEYNIAIECQGIQHFRAISYFGGDDKLKYIQKIDENKLKLCREHGINILYYSNLGEDFPYNYNVITDINTLINEIKKGRSD